MANHQILEQVVAEWQHLQHNWRQAQEDWDDNVRQQFETHYWQGIESTSTDYIDALKALQQSIEKVNRLLP